MEKDLGRKALYFSPHKVNTFCCSPVKKNNSNKMKMKMAWFRKTSRSLKNGFIHFYRFETYKWGCSQSKFTFKDSFVVVANYLNGV